MDQVTAVSFEDTCEVMERLGEITVPTLVLWGDQDQWMPGAGRFAAEDDLYDTAQALMRFLA